MITTILFDNGKVLSYPRCGNWFITPNTFKLLGHRHCQLLEDSKAKLPLAVNKAYCNLMSNHLLFTEDEEIQQFSKFFKEISDEINLGLNSIKCSVLAHDLVYNDSRLALYDDTLDTLKNLKKEFKIGILSDAWPSLRRILANSGISPLLDGLIISCEHNLTKEDLGLFEIALSVLKEPAENILFIDDSEANLINARGLGMHPVLMDRDNKKKDSQFVTINSLGEIGDLLTKMV